jgi:hypothetical protein
LIITLLLQLNEADESGVDRFTVVAVQRDDGPSTKAVSLANLLLAASSISTFGSTSQSQLSATKVIGDSDEEKQIVKGILTDRDGGRNLEQGEEQDRKIEKFPFAQTFRLILIGILF